MEADFCAGACCIARGSATCDEISNRKINKNRIVELDTGVTLCCSVRQRAAEIQAVVIHA